MTNYCGYGDWPDCATLANTGINGGDLIIWVVVGIALIGLGIAAWRHKR